MLPNIFPCGAEQPATRAELSWAWPGLASKGALGPCALTSQRLFSALNHEIYVIVSQYLPLKKPLAVGSSAVDLMGLTSSLQR